MLNRKQLLRSYSNNFTEAKESSESDSKQLYSSIFIFKISSFKEKIPEPITLKKALLPFPEIDHKYKNKLSFSTQTETRSWFYGDFDLPKSNTNLFVRNSLGFENLKFALSKLSTSIKIADSLVDTYYFIQKPSLAKFVEIVLDLSMLYSIFYENYSLYSVYSLTSISVKILCESYSSALKSSVVFFSLEVIEAVDPRLSFGIELLGFVKYLYDCAGFYKMFTNEA